MKSYNLLIPLLALGIITSCTTDPKVQSRNWVSKGDKYAERNKNTEASIMYRRALQKDAKNALAWYKLGLLDLKTGKPGEARGAFIRVTDLSEASAAGNLSKDQIEDAYTKTGDIDYLAFLSSLGKGQENAQKEFRKELRATAKKLNQKYPKTFDAYREMGLYDWATALKRKLDEDADDRRDPPTALQSALTNFLAADQLRPYDPTLGFAIVSTYFDTNHPEQAEQYAKQLIARNKAENRVYDTLWRYYFTSKRLDDAEQVRKQEVAQNPKSAQAWLRLASHYAAAHRKDDMTATLNKLTSDLKTFPNAYMLVGDFYYANYDLGSAVASYQQGEKSDASNRAKYLKKEAEALSFAGKYDEAAKRISEVLRQSPKDAEAIAMNASLILNHAKPAEADGIIAQLQPLLAKTPGDQVDQATILHFNLGRAYALKGDPQSTDQARLQFQEVINLRSAAQRAPYIPALMALSEMELQRGENPTAIEHAEQILRLAPLNVTAHLVRTMGLINMGEYDKARTELDALLKYDPKSKDARFQLARLDLAQKRYADADSEFQALQSVNDPRGFSGILESKVRQGKAPDAIQMIQAQLAKSPNQVAYRDALANLYFGTRQYANALLEYRKLLDQNPNEDARARVVWTIRVGRVVAQLGRQQRSFRRFQQGSANGAKRSSPAAGNRNTAGSDRKGRGCAEDL